MHCSIERDPPVGIGCQKLLQQILTIWHSMTTQWHKRCECNTQHTNASMDTQLYGVGNKVFLSANTFILVSSRRCTATILRYLQSAVYIHKVKFYYSDDILVTWAGSVWLTHARYLLLVRWRGSSFICPCIILTSSARTLNGSTVNGRLPVSIANMFTPLNTTFIYSTSLYSKNTSAY